VEKKQTVSDVEKRGHFNTRVMCTPTSEARAAWIHHLPRLYMYASAVEGTVEVGLVYKPTDHSNNYPLSQHIVLRE
jgi:hypothetical protein